MSHRDESAAPELEFQSEQRQADHTSDSELSSLLGLIKAQIDAVENRQHEALAQMQGQLDELGQQARSTSARVPENLAPAFQRIEDSMAHLADELGNIADSSQSHTEHNVEPAGLHIDDEPMPNHDVFDQDNVPGADLANSIDDTHRAPDGPVVSTPDAFPAHTTVADVMPAAGMPIAHQNPGDQEGFSDSPWDAHSAEALMQVYERDEPELVAQEPAAVSPEAATPQMFAQSLPNNDKIAETAAPRESDHEWLTARFGEIAVLIEQSFSEAHEKDPVHALQENFAQFQQDLATALQDVATRADLESVQVAEARIDEMMSKIESFQSELARLDSVESQLESVMDRLTDDRLTQLFQTQSGSRDDLVQIATAAAEDTVERLSGSLPNQEPSDNSQGVETLRQALEDFMDEQRRGSSETASALDTMQQAMIGVLDRVESIAEQQVSGPQPAETPNTDPQRASDETYIVPRSGEPRDDAAAEPLAYEPVEPDATDNATVIVHRQDEHLPQEDEQHYDPTGGPYQDAADEQPQSDDVRGIVAEDQSHLTAVERLRREFIAEAQQAQQRAEAAAAQQAAEGGTSKRRFQLNLPFSQGSNSGSTNPFRGSTGLSSGDPMVQESSSTVFGISRRKLLVGAFCLLIATSGVLLLMPSKSPPAPDASQITRQLPSAPAPKTTKPKAEVAPESKGGEAPAEEQPFEFSDPAAEDGKGLGDRSEIRDGDYREFSHFPGEGDGAPDVLDGIALQESARHLTPAEFEKLSEHQSSAHWSAKLGAAAAEATPAALLPEYFAEKDKAEPAKPVTGAKAKRATELPPASVGPLSLRLAAANGDPSAEFEVAARLAAGKGTDQNLKQAATWYKRSASRGFAQAQYRLGTLYERGLGLKKDHARARVWYQRAAAQGNMKAMHNLAVLSVGKSSSPDYATAAEWFKKAADHGLADSQFNLAVLYQNGFGVAQDLKQAYKYFALAARSGDKDAIGRRDEVKGLLDVDALALAEDLVSSWRRKPTSKLANDVHAAGQAWKKGAHSPQGI